MAEPYVKSLANSFVQTQDQKGDYTGKNFNGGVSGGVSSAARQYTPNPAPSAGQAPEGSGAAPDAAPLSPGAQAAYEQIRGSLPSVTPDPSLPQRLADARQAVTDSRLANLERKPTFMESFTNPSIATLVGAGVGTLIGPEGTIPGAIAGNAVKAAIDSW